MAIAFRADLVKPQVSVWEIGPSEASVLLGANTHNRHLRPTVVSRYARDMAEGRWDFNGEAIQIATDGTILNGQHRLHAIVASGVTVRAIVVIGLPLDAQATIDRGAPRNTADAMTRQGEVNVIILSGAIANAIVLKSPDPTSSRFWPSTAECLAYLDAHPGVRRSVHVGDHLSKALRMPGVSSAALHHLFSEIDEDDADAFFDSLASGHDLASDSPIFRLRDLMLKEIGATRRMGRSRLHALAIKSWNSWRLGRPVLVLTWRVGGSKPEPFPKPE